MVIFCSFEDTYYFVTLASLFLESASLFSTHMAVMETVMLGWDPVLWSRSLFPQSFMDWGFWEHWFGVFLFVKGKRGKLRNSLWLTHSQRDWRWVEQGAWHRGTGKWDWRPCFLFPVQVFLKTPLCPDNTSPFCLHLNLLLVTCKPPKTLMSSIAGSLNHSIRIWWIWVESQWHPTA